MTQLLENAAFGAMMILVVVALRRALKDRLAPGARLALWGVCLFRLLTPRPFQSILSLWGLVGRLAPAPAMDAPNPAPAALGSPALALPPEAAVSAPLPETPVNPVVPVVDPTPAAFPWGKVLTAAWVLVGAALAVWYLVGWFRARRAVSCAVPVGEDDPRRRFLPRFAQLREGPVEGAPLTFGVVRPQVVLSPGLDEGELACVLAHEGVHARRRDNLWHYAMAAALVVHWWNPAVWLMGRLLRRDIELACDRAALKQLGEDRRAEYAQALVSLSTQGEGNGPAFCQSFGRKATEERIRSIMKFKKPTVIGVVLTLVLVLGVSIAFASDPKAPEDDYVDRGVILDDYKVANVPTATDEYGNSLVYDEDGNLLIVGTRDHGGPNDLCTDADCPVEGSDAYYREHYHDENGIVVWVRVATPGMLCTREDCTRDGCHQHDGIVYDARAASITPEQYAGMLKNWAALAMITPQEADEWLEIFQTCYERVQRGECDAFHYNIYDCGKVSSAWYFSDRVAAGYPVNSKGETYGPDLPEVYGASPDLILATGTNGEEGYVRNGEGDHLGYPGGVNNPEEAMAYMEWCKTQPATVYIPLYDCEGNEIGKFAMSNSYGQAGTVGYLEDAQAETQAAAQSAPQAVVTAAGYPVCHVDGCTAEGQHTHNGATYCGGAAHHGDTCDGSCIYHTLASTPSGDHHEEPVCTVAGCTQTGAHHHDPAQTLCTVAGCTAAGEHEHNGVHYCGTAVACTVDGCGSTGVHQHNGVTYNGCANAAHHESAASSTSSNTTTSGHHSESHSSGHHGNHH